MKFEPLKIRFEGKFADEHVISANKLSKSLSGIDMIINNSLDFIDPLNSPSKRGRTDFRVMVGPPKQGSLELIIQIVSFSEFIPIIYEQFPKHATDILWGTFISALLFNGNRVKEGMELLSPFMDYLRFIHELASLRFKDELEYKRFKGELGYKRFKDGLEFKRFKGELGYKRFKDKLDAKILSEEREFTERREIRNDDFLLKFADKCSAPAKNVIAPIGIDAATVNLQFNTTITTMCETDAKEIRLTPKESISEYKTYHCIVDGADVSRHTLALIVDELPGSVIKAKVNDEKFDQAEDCYTESLYKRTKIEITARLVMKDGKVVRLEVSDAKPI